MTTYIVTFDVSNSSRLLKIKGILRSYDRYCPIHENAWAIRDNKTAVGIRDELNQEASPEDRIFVIRTGVEAAWTNTYGEENSEWLKEYL